MLANFGTEAPDGPTCFCRDCLVDLDFARRRCGKCGSPRLVRHRVLAALTLAHIDCDAFYATVEKRDNPEIADKPVIIGGGKRGVVSAACYISRTFGVRSAMPMFKALALCPSAIVIRPDMAKYVRVGREVRHAMQALTPLVEPLSIDEAFLDLAGTQRVHGMIPAKVLARFAREVERNIGITVSVGLSCNKFLAKIASDMDKPRGFATLDQEEARAMLADKPVGFIFGVGPATQERLIAARLSHHRRSAARRRNRTDEAVLDRRPQAVAAGARHRRSPRGGGSRRQDHFQRNHVRDRHPRFRHAGKNAVAAVGKGVVAPQEQRPRRLDRHAETEDRRFQAAHPLAIDSRPDAAGGEDLRDLPRDAGEGDRRHRVPADGHRRQRAAAGIAGR